MFAWFAAVVAGIALATWLRGARRGPMLSYRVSKVSEEFRRKAEACRRLADTAEDQYRRALWIERAAEWERLAAKATKQ